MTPPLIVRVEPIAGETLLSLATRAAHANVFPKLADLLNHAGIGGHPAFVPFTAADRAQPLAELLGLPLDAVAERFHPLHPDRRFKDARIWAGIRVRRRSIEARTRRVAPMALKTSPHHRLEWTHRALSFCPETLQQLISSCPACGAELGWVTTKGLDRCERCEASLLDAPAPMVATRSPARLRAAARLISPDPRVRASAIAALPCEFAAWDAGDLFAALCELGLARRRAGEGGDPVLGRALEDGSHRFEPEDLARGHALLERWPENRHELLDRLASASAAPRAHGRLTAAHLGVLRRHLRPMASGATLAGLITQAVEAEAEARRQRRRQVKLDRAALQARLTGSIGLVEACRAFGISRPVLSRLVPDGRSLIAAKSRREGGIRFDRAALKCTIGAYKASMSFSSVALRLGAPRYCMPALIAAGVLEAPEDPDVARLFGEGAVTARSAGALFKRLAASPGRVRTTYGLRSLDAHLRRRFDPTVWAAVFREALDNPRAHQLTIVGGAQNARPFLDRVMVLSAAIGLALCDDDPRHIDPGVELKSWEAGRLLGLSADHLPELVEAGFLKGRRGPRGWVYDLQNVREFHSAYVTGAEISQRHASALAGWDPNSELWSSESGEERGPKLSELFDTNGTRHFRILQREEVERMLPWPDSSLN